MDTVALVENQIDEGQRFIDRLLDKGIALRSACWVKPYEEDRWTLYIATPLVDEKGSLGAYGDVLPILQSLKTSWITSSDVTLVSENHAIVQDALDIMRRFPHNTPIRSPRPLLGGMPVEEVYVYSLNNVDVPVYGMVFMGEPSGSLHLSFEPHSPHSAFEVGIGKERKVYPGKTGIDWVVAAPDGARLERNSLGQLVLVWDRHSNRVESTPNEVWSFAKIALHGFRFVRRPN